jgi:thiamine-phosphate pyrophosphorylase
MLPHLHAVTDERVARTADLDRRAGELAGGASGDLALHARGRGLSGREHYELAVRLSLPAGALLFVNERVDVALAVRAQGVQLGQGAMSPVDARRLRRDWWIGASVHDVEEAHAARDAGADYLVVGPVYATASHPGRPPLGVEGFAEMAAIGLPAIAIGGITVERVGAVRAAGAYGIGAIRALWDASDPARAARDMLAALGI